MYSGCNPVYPGCDPVHPGCDPVCTKAATLCVPRLRLERQPLVPEWLRNLFSPPEEEEEEGQEVRQAASVAMLSRPHHRNGVLVGEARPPC